SARASVARSQVAIAGRATAGRRFELGAGIDRWDKGRWRGRRRVAIHAHAMPPPQDAAIRPDAVEEILGIGGHVEIAHDLSLKARARRLEPPQPIRKSIHRGDGVGRFHFLLDIRPTRPRRNLAERVVGGGYFPNADDGLPMRYRVYANVRERALAVLRQ